MSVIGWTYAKENRFPCGYWPTPVDHLADDRLPIIYACAGSGRGSGVEFAQIRHGTLRLSVPVICLLLAQHNVVLAGDHAAWPHHRRVPFCRQVWCTCLLELSNT